MKTRFIYSGIVCLVLAGTIFSGCSSGGASDGTAVSEGFFVDSPVQGLTYKGNLDGVTDSDGRYFFMGSQRVEFLLGDKLSLGTLVPKTSIVSVLDFFDNKKTTDDPTIQKLLVVLQSLDSDGNASNGITIIPQSIAVLESQLLAENPTADLKKFDITKMTPVQLKSILQKVVDKTEPIKVLKGNTHTTVEDVVVEEEDAVDHFTETFYGPQPPAPDINGTALACGGEYFYSASDYNASDYNASDAVKINVSSSGISEEEDYNFNKEDPTSHNTIKRLDLVVPGTSFHPIVVSYGQQVLGEFEMGDGSADIGDPEHRDALFFAKSLDNGDTWKNVKISNSEDKTSTEVTWGNDANGTESISFYGHIQKPKMAVAGNKILLAWNDKYCPSGNPFNLALSEDDNQSYPDDFFGVNGTQGSILYTGEDGGVMTAPNGKKVYEVPFSCVWTARGVMDTAGDVTWQRPMQLTSGLRDSNHIWIEGSETGFAMTWQEDTAGLRSGKGAGPGEGWSGATTNRGSDIWYTSIKMDDFDATDSDALTSGDAIMDARPASLNNFHYPVRITDNEMCSSTDKKAYCRALCTGYGSALFTTQNNAQTQTDRCYTYDIDMLDGSKVLLNGDTGASRPALKLLKTNEDETVVVLAYEETKGLTERVPGVGDQTQGDEDTAIEFEGKSVYFESFNFNAIDSFDPTASGFDANDINTSILATAMPLVSAGNIVNVQVADQNDSAHFIYENARRVVIGTHVDSCKAQDFTFAIMYKQSFETQGASSDMFIRVNNGFTYDSFVPLATGYGNELNVTNVSSQKVEVAEITDIAEYSVDWIPSNLEDNTYENSYENTFSPRIFLRGDGNDGANSGDGVGGDDIFIGYEYTPNGIVEVEGEGTLPSNFHTHIYSNGKWQGPVNVTQVVVPSATTVDARFFTTPKGIPTSAGGLESDQGNPNVLFVTWGEIGWVIDGQDGLGKAETDLFYKRALYDAETKVWVWDTNSSKLAAIAGGVVEEKEVESLASPDGKTIYNVWLQESDPDLVTQYETAKGIDISDHAEGVDSWFGRVDFNISNSPVDDNITIP